MRRFQLKLGICFVAIYYEITWMRSWCQGWPLNNNQKRMLEHVKGEVRRGQVYCRPAWWNAGETSCFLIDIKMSISRFQPIQMEMFGDATNGFPAIRRLRIKCRNSILMTRHHPDLGSASDWLNQISHWVRPIRRTTQIWVVMRHQYGIFALVSQTPFGGETSGSVAKCRLFSQASTGQTAYR